MNIYFFIFSLFFLQLVCFFVGKKSSANLQNQEDYFLAGKSIKFFPLMMTFLATQVGGGLVLGSAEEAYRYGWVIIFYPLGSALGLFLLAMGLGKKMAHYQVSTIAQLFEVIYKSTPLKKFASSLSIISLFMIFVAQITASKKFMISLGVENEGVFLLFWAIVIFYTVAGGLKAVVATDVVQASFFLGIFVISFMFVLINASGNTYSFNEIPPSSFDYSKLLGWLTMPMLFMVIEQDMAQRCFAAKTPQVVTRSAGYAALITCLICLIPIFFGILARQMNIPIPEGGSVLISIIQVVTTPYLAALVGCAVLAAIISTADSLINAISSNISQDFNLKFLHKFDPIKTAQFITGAIAVAGLIISPFFINILDLLVFSYELCVACLFVPIIFGIYKKENHRSSAYCAIICGGLGILLLKPVEVTFFPKELCSVTLSLLGFGASELAHRFYPIKQTAVD